MEWDSGFHPESPIAPAEVVPIPSGDSLPPLQLPTQGFASDGPVAARTRTKRVAAMAGLDPLPITLPPSTRAPLSPHDWGSCRAGHVPKHSLQ